MRLLPLEQHVVGDVARWYGPAGSKQHVATVHAVAAWLAEFRRQLEAGDVGPSLKLCGGRRATPIECCWRVHFSAWDVPRTGADPKPASGARAERIVAEVVELGGEPSVRVPAIGPNYAGRGPGRRAWVYEQAAHRRRYPYCGEKKGGGKE